ncbi:protein O-mannosyl-transferase TMTC1-like isoform X1 [Lytechinus pictus]|uniref:protein O-mannosyl-transferase TMTC1-like isoform X1 n=1 Tax=Lytechinus pictus TaxID=7653 RepID=UPI0030B9FB65
MTGRRCRKSHSPPGVTPNQGNHNNNNNCISRIKGLSLKGSSWNPSTLVKPKRHSQPINSSTFDSLPLPSGPDWLFYAVIAAVSFAVFSNALRGDFVHDDVFAIKNNKDLLPSTPLSKVFQNDFWGKSMSDNTSHKSYRPLCVLTFRLNYLMSGYQPYSYHLWNVCLHSAVCIIFTFVTHRVVFNDIRPAFISGLLFAVHPVHTEAVAGVVGRADVLSCLCFLLAFLAYSRCIVSERPKQEERCYQPTSTPYLILSTSIPHLVLCIFLSLCGLLVKEHSATVLGVCLCYDAIVKSWPFLTRYVVKSKSSTLPADLIPFIFRSAILIGAAFVFLSFRLWMLNGHLPHFSEEDNPASFAPHLTTRFLTYSYLVAFNILLLLCPTTLSHDWQEGSIPLVESLWDPRNAATLLAFASLCLITFHCIFRSKDTERRVLACGLLFLAVPFLPASNLLIKVGFVVAERILYIPSLGFCILVCYGIFKMAACLTSRSSRAFLSIATLIMVLCFCRRTWVRNRVWESRETLFKSGLETLPHNAKMHYNYGNYLMDTGLRTEAIKHFQETLSLYPRHASANNNLGTLLSESEPQRAADFFHEAIRINPLHARAYFNLANIYHNRGELATAEALFLKALEIDPQYLDVFISLASLKQVQGDITAAEGLYRQGLENGEPSADLHNNYAAFLMGNDHHQEALYHYGKCLKIDPAHVVAMTNKARLLRHLNRTDEAEDMYIRSLSYSNNAKTLQSLAAIYYNTDRPSKALGTYKEALDLEPHNLEIQLQYAQVMTRLGLFKEAEAYLTEALDSNPTTIELHRLLSSVYSVQHRYQEALRQVEVALGLTKITDVETKAELLFEKANHLKGLNKIEESQKTYVEVLSLNPEMGSCLLNLGAIHHLKGDYKQARMYYMRALTLDPKNEILIENIAKLKRAESKARRTT